MCSGFRFALVLVVILTVTNPTNAFTAPSSRLTRERAFIHVARYAKQERRKHRFSQDAHGNEIIKPKSKAPPRKEGNNPPGKGGNNPPRKIGNNAKIRADPKTSKLPSTDSDDGYMWRTGKSIEELEKSLTRRWGTSIQAYTADPNEYELDSSDESGRLRTNLSPHAKPVLDPWQKETDKKTNADIFKRSQPEFSEKKTRDFYDPDDEGFESSSADPSKDHFGKLFSPKPVNGMGSDTIAPTQKGFFFDHLPPKQVSEENPPSTRESKGKQKASLQQQKSHPIPIIDSDDGKPMCLTVDLVESKTKAHKESSDNNLATETQVHWEELGLSSSQLLTNLKSMSCEIPLSVQRNACPPILTASDVLIGTHTGSGKTLAFLAPIVQRILLQDGKDGMRALIVVPGRELASQIVSVARELLQHTGLSVLLCIGGTTFSRNVDQIRRSKPSIIVGTPGRIAELIVGRPGDKKGRVNINALQSLVLDEFDALLQYKPHQDPTNAIISKLKSRHGDSLQIVACSATAHDITSSKTPQLLLRDNYIDVTTDPSDLTGKKSKGGNRVSSTIVHGVIHVPREQLVMETVRRILHTDPFPQQVLIFADNAKRVDYVVEKLSYMGILAAPLNGMAEKIDRAGVSRALRQGEVGIVVATELAARGLDAPLLTHVINLDLPTDASHYAHRAGRCGRRGRPGVVINLTSKAKERSVPFKFADRLDVDMHTVVPRDGKLIVVEADSVSFN